MDIRRARPDDAVALGLLARQTYAEHFAGMWSAQGLEQFLEREFGLPGLSGALAATDQAWFIASDADGAWLGYAKINWQRTEPVSQTRGAELQKIYFRAGATGCGHGSILLTQLMEAARAQGEHAMWLNVLDTNERGRRFYERHGFRHVGTSSFRGDAHPLEMLALARTLD